MKLKRSLKNRPNFSKRTLKEQNLAISAAANFAKRVIQSPLEKKKGLSPVIATVLLVGIAVVLAVIIFLWAKNFVGEAITKEGRAIDLLCDEVSFEAEAYGGRLYIENTGSVPLHGVQIRDEGFFGDVTAVKEFPGIFIASGQTEDVSLNEVDAGATILVVPMLLGEVDDSSKKHAYVCDKDYGREIEVGA